MTEQRRKNFFDFAREGGDEFGDLTVTTRQQAKSACKRIRFADEISVQGLDDSVARDEPNDTPTEAPNSEDQEERRVTGSTPASPNARTRLLTSDHLQEEPTLRLVVPTTMIQEVLQNCHDSLEGGHQGIARTFYRVKLDYYWVGLYADVARHVRSCPDCSSSKSRPKLRGYSPGNILAERPFQIVSMDFVIPLPKSRLDTGRCCYFSVHSLGS
ncbi:reverse transcriptase [Phytophthora megakarya]|uniref:Reverse transcriptase n=1 Tax=Phytophthora megakarya TaxID=4795 RepID=A0A225UG00_9STRA|nr:reverse transcriptase [Phytophthora megakarya]